MPAVTSSFKTVATPLAQQQRPTHASRLEQPKPLARDAPPRPATRGARRNNRAAVSTRCRGSKRPGAVGLASREPHLDFAAVLRELNSICGFEACLRDNLRLGRSIATGLASAWRR